MKKPRKLINGATTYKIRWLRKGFKADQGITLYHKSEIHINSSFPLSTQRVALIHEMGHVLLENCPHFDSGDVTKKCSVSEEDVVTYIDHPLLTMMKNNPEVMAFVLGDDE